jgi:hypothetical protein
MFFLLFVLPYTNPDLILERMRPSRYLCVCVRACGRAETLYYQRTAQNKLFVVGSRPDSSVGRARTPCTPGECVVGGSIPSPGLLLFFILRETGLLELVNGAS